MSQLIKSAKIYTTHLPEWSTLAANLSECKIEPLKEGTPQTRAMGFVAVDEEDPNKVLRVFQGGMQFRFRMDEKVIPNKVLKAEVRVAIERIKQETGRKPGRKERIEIRDSVKDELACKAFVTSTEVDAFYDPANHWLIIATTQQKVCDALVSHLVYACESVKMETIYVSDVAMGLTTRLKNWLAQQADEAFEGEVFGDLETAGTVELQQDKRRLRVKMDTLAQAELGLKTAMNQGFTVKSIGLTTESGTHFTLTDVFDLRSVVFPNKVEAEEGAEDPWMAQAILEMGEMSALIAKLTEMFSAKEASDAAA